MIGLRIRDPITGIEHFGPTDRITRMIGQVTIGPNAGSLSVPEFTSGLGQPWYTILDTAFMVDARNQPPSVSLTSTGFSWIVRSGTGRPGRTVTLVYGVY